MPRNYVPEWIKCPLCRESVRITDKNIIFKHSRLYEGCLLQKGDNIYNFLEECPASKTVYQSKEINNEYSRVD